MLVMINVLFTFTLDIWGSHISSLGWRCLNDPGQKKQGIDTRGGQESERRSVGFIAVHLCHICPVPGCSVHPCSSASPPLFTVRHFHAAVSCLLRVTFLSGSRLWAPIFPPAVPLTPRYRRVSVRLTRLIVTNMGTREKRSG